VVESIGADCEADVDRDERSAEERRMACQPRAVGRGQHDRHEQEGDHELGDEGRRGAGPGAVAAKRTAGCPASIPSASPRAIFPSRK